MGLRTSMSVDEIARGAECVASLTGCAIMLSSQILSFPDVVLAVGFAMAFLGGVFSARSSTQAIPIEKRLPYTIIGFIITTAMIAMVCYIVWDYTSSIASLLCALTVATIAWLATFKVTQLILKYCCGTIPTTGKTDAEI